MTTVVLKFTPSPVFKHPVVGPKHVEIPDITMVSAEKTSVPLGFRGNFYGLGSGDAQVAGIRGIFCGDHGILNLGRWRLGDKLMREHGGFHSRGGTPRWMVCKCLKWKVPLKWMI